MVQFENVGVRYGTGPEVLSDITFDLPDSSFHFVTGPSGAGKSSLLKLMYLALRPSRGLISLFARNAASYTTDELPAVRRQIGVVFQNFRLIDHLSTFDNVALPLRVSGAAESMIQKHVTELLGWVGLADHLEARPPTLSGGQQQRVAIARAVIARPRLLLADEPTGNVDDMIAVRLLYLFEELNRMGTTVVIATHNEYLVNRFGIHNYISKVGAWTHALPPAATDMAQRTDLPLSDDSTTRLVPWIVGVMAYLAALALAAALTLSNVAREWGDGLEGSLTVQIPAAEDDALQTTDAKIVAAVRVLLKTDGVDSARPIPLAEIGKMLEPWLGSVAATTDSAIATGHRRSAQAGCDDRFYHPRRASEERGARVPRLRPTRNGGIRCSCSSNPSRPWQSSSYY